VKPPLLILAILLLPAPASAEGARRFFDCEVQQLCDAAGQCDAAATPVLFTLEPLAVASNGAGSYRLTYDNDTVEMDALAEAGPFRWTLGAEHHTLLASSETRFLWHQLDLSGTPSARIAFLACTVRY
jgi:hypothetical protein